MIYWDVFDRLLACVFRNMRIPGILQRIAFAYFVVAMMKLFLPVYTIRGFVRRGQWEDAPRNRLAIFTHYSLHWLVAFSFFFLYVGIMLFAHVPTWCDFSPILLQFLLHLYSILLHFALFFSTFPPFHLITLHLFSTDTPIYSI